MPHPYAQARINKANAIAADLYPGRPLATNDDSCPDIGVCTTCGTGVCIGCQTYGHNEPPTCPECLLAGGNA